MAIDTALVTGLTGQVWLRGADGELTVLRVGMRVPVNAELVTGQGASVHLQIAGLPDMVIGENREFLFSADVVDLEVDTASAAVTEPESPRFDSLIAAIEAGQDPFDELDPTAAILEGGSEGGGTFVRLTRILESTSPLDMSYARTETADVDNLRLGSVVGTTTVAQDEVDVSQGGSPGSGDPDPIVVGMPATEAEIQITSIAGDGIINDAESRQAEVSVAGTVGKDVKVGDTVTVWINGQSFTGTVGVDKTWVINVPGSVFTTNASLEIRAEVTTRDESGNITTASTIGQYAIDMQAYASITIDTVAGDDVLNDAEASVLMTTVTGRVGGDVKVGDDITLTVNGKTFTGKVIEGPAGSLVYSIDVSTADLVASPSIDASVTATDAAGNSKTATATKLVGVDRAAEASITIDAVAGDDVLNDVEASALMTTVTGKVGGDVKVGDDVTLTVNGKAFTGKAIEGSAGSLVYSIDVATADLVASPSIEASVIATDAAGNSKTAFASHSVTVDRVAEASITIDTVAGDDVLNDAEASALKTTVTGKVGGDVKVGDDVTLTVNGKTFTGKVIEGPDAGTLVYSIDVTTADLLASPSIEASVTATDDAGNSRTAFASQSIAVDRAAEASITIDTVAGDDVLNDAEAVTSTTTITGKVGGDVKVGDDVTLTVNGKTFTGKVIEGPAGSLVYSIDVATADLLASPSIEASVTATDAAGNSKTATANKLIGVDRVAEASITIDTVAGDDVLNDTEASALMTTVTGKVGGDVKVGDDVTLTVNGKTFTGKVAEGAAGTLVYSIDVTTADLLASPSIDANVTATDAAGNSKTATANKLIDVDRAADASITIDTVAGDDVLSDAEASTSRTTITGKVGGDVKVGDDVTLTVNGKTFTGKVAEGLAGALVYSIDVTTTDLVASPSFDASVTATDAAGNSKTATANKLIGVDRTAGASITIDTVAGDDVLNDAEASVLMTTVTGRVGGDVKVGDDVTLTVNGKTFTGKVAEGVAGALVYSIDVTTADLVASPNIEANVTATDIAGNSKTASASHSVTLDRVAEASITIDTVAGDDVLNNAEASALMTTVTGKVGGDVKIGDDVTLTVNGKTFTGKVIGGPDAGALVYSIDVTTADLAASPSINASVTATDAAGNSKTATANKLIGVDRVAEASITIDAVAGDDVLNDVEASALITTVTGKVGGDVKIGDDVTLTVNGKTFTGKVIEGPAGALVYSIDVTTADLLASPSIDASVTATDAAGNSKTATANKLIGVDRAAEASITIDTVAGDDVLNDVEASALMTTVTGKVGGDVKVGDDVTLTVNGKTFTGKVAEGAAGTLVYSVDVTTADLLASPSLEASVTATDAAGNSKAATANKLVGVDRAAEASITIDAVAGDDVLNDTEASALMTTVTGEVGGDAKVGDDVTLTVNGKTFTGKVAEGLAGALVYSIEVTTADLVASPSIDASVTATDAAGNSKAATANKVVGVDRAAEASITIDTVAGDDVLNDAEASTSRTTITGKVGGDVKVGDDVTLTVNGKTLTGKVTEGTAGSLVYNIDVSTADLVASPSIDASVTATDAAGNSKTATANKLIDVDRAADASITIDTVAGDDVLNDAEASTSRTTITGKVGGDVKVGDDVTLTVNGKTVTGKVAEGAAGALVYSIDVATADLLASPSIDASVTATDVAGNSKTATANRLIGVDRAAEASITIDTVAGDEVLNDTEASALMTTVTGKVSGDVKVGDDVTLTVNGNIFTGKVAEGAAGTLVYSIDVTTADLLASPNIDASVTATDAAGNSKTATANKIIGVDRTAEASITIDTVAGDDVLNDAEASALMTTVTGKVGGDVKVGDDVTLTVNGKTFTGIVAEGASGALIYSIDVTTTDLVASPSFDASVTATDAAGNSKTATANKLIGVDRTADASITIDAVAGDDVLNDVEASALTTTVTGKVGGDVKVGDDVTLTVNGKTFIGKVTEGTAGSLVYSVHVSTADLVASPSIDASVTATDAAGNSKTATTNKLIGVDRVAEASITIDTVAGDDVLNDAEASALRTTVTGKVGGDVKVGDDVTLTVNGKAFTGKVIEGSAGSLVYSIDVATADLVASPSIEASVTATDVAGNSKTATVTKLLDVDRVAEASIMIDAVAGDDVLNDVEVSALMTTVTGKVGGDVKVGDDVTLTVNGKTFTGKVIEGPAGSLVYSIDVATADLLASPSIDASVTATDVAGNSKTATANRLIGVDRAAEASITIDTVAGDDVLNDTEASALMTTVTGKVGGDVKVGDDVTLTVNGKTFTGKVIEGPAGALVYSVDVATADLLASPSIDASVTATDAAGNSKTATANKLIGVDRIAEASITIDTVADDDIVSGAEASALMTTVTGKVGGDVKVGDDVTLTVNGKTFTGKVAEGESGALVYSIEVTTTDLVASPRIDASVTAIDAAGNRQTADASRVVTIDVSAPDADGSTVVGTEDESVAVNWQDLNVRGDDVDYIVINEIPGKGLLEYRDLDGLWKAVVRGQEFTSEEVDLGLRFTPDGNESGAGYADIRFSVVDKVGNVGSEATVTIDVTPVADAPTVSLSISEGKVIPGSSASEIIQINGGSGTRGGFDVQDGKIIRINDGVRVWLTEGDSIPEIVSSGAPWAPGAIAYYGSHGNPQGENHYIDVFVIHQNSSGFYRQADWPADRKDVREIQAVHGNTVSNGPGAFKDYIFVQGSFADQGSQGFYATHDGKNNQNLTNVNTLTGVNVTYTDAQGNTKTLIRGGNNLEGIIFGDGKNAVLADPADTSIPAIEPTTGYVEYELDVSASLSDLDGSESLSGITLTGLPVGAILSYGAITVTIGADGTHVVANPHNYAVNPVAGQESPGSSLAVSLIIKVPEGAESFTIKAEATSTELESGNTAVGRANAGVEMPIIEILPPEESPPPVAAEPIPTGDNILKNGSFSEFANATEWWSGNNDQGYKYWAATGSVVHANKNLIAGKPYVGVWDDGATNSTLSQQISGVTAGSVLQFKLGWNNPNVGVLNDQWNPITNTGRSVELKISIGGVVYAVISTPVGSKSVADSQFALVTALNGASVNMDRIETWTNQYAHENSNNPQQPTSEQYMSDLFAQLRITLPADVPGHGELKFHWQAGADAGQATDDVIIGNIELLQGIPQQTSGMMVASVADLLIEDDAQALDFEHDAAALLGLNGILGDGDEVNGPEIRLWENDGALADFGFSDSSQPESFGAALDLAQLFTDIEASGDSLDQYLLIETGESGVETVLKVSQDGAVSADHYSQKFILQAGVSTDFLGADNQAQLIQSMISDGKLKVDQM